MLPNETLFTYSDYSNWFLALMAIIFTLIGLMNEYLLIIILSWFGFLFTISGVTISMFRLTEFKSLLPFCIGGDILIIGVLIIMFFGLNGGLQLGSSALIKGSGGLKPPVSKRKKAIIKSYKNWKNDRL